MEIVVRKLLEAVEHVVYSHTFRSETTANRAHQLLGEARVALDELAPAQPAAAAAEPAVTAEPAVIPAPAEAPVSAPVDNAPAPPSEPAGPEAYGNA